MKNCHDKESTVVSRKKKRFWKGITYMTVAALCKLAALPPNNKGIDMNLLPGFPK